MEYTNECLLGFLAAEINIAVNCWLRTETWYARMKVTPNGRATITIGWPEIIEEFRLVEGDICTFSFTDERNAEGRDAAAWLRLLITALED